MENPYNPEVPISFFQEEYYEQETDTFNKKTLTKYFTLVDVNSDNCEELIFSIKDGLDEIMVILGIVDQKLIVFDVFETHTSHISFTIFDHGIVMAGQNYDGEEYKYYSYDRYGKPKEEFDSISTQYQGALPVWHNLNEYSDIVLVR